MSKLSIIIPAWKEPLLHKTIASIFEKATGDIEVIASLDGALPYIMPKENPRLIIHRHSSPGMRGSINEGLKLATGKYIMKVDAHCSFGLGFDEVLCAYCEENQLVIPRRFSLCEDTWGRVSEETRYWDYHYFDFPYFMVSPTWYRGEEHNKIAVDDTMTMQGSCWLANKNYFMSHVGFLDDSIDTYGNFSGEQHEITLKYWLGEGEVKVIKATWYAHLNKRKRHYASGEYDRHRKNNYNTRRHEDWIREHWLKNEEPNMIHPFTWLIEKFMPVPSWPEDRTKWAPEYMMNLVK